MGTSKGIMGIIALTLGLFLSAIPLLAQPGYTPGEAIPVTPGVWEYNSARTPSVSFNSPSGCFPYNGPYWDEYWFKFTAGKNDKILFVDASTMRGVDEGLPDRKDFLAILFVFEMTPNGLSQIGCHAYGSSWILSAHPGSTYLFMVAGLDSTAVPGEDPQFTGHGGSIALTIESNPHGVMKYNEKTAAFLWIYWNAEDTGLVSAHATNPGYYCDPGEDNLLREHWVRIRPGTWHYGSQGDAYTRVYHLPSPQAWEEFFSMLNTWEGTCDFIRNVNGWKVAEGMAHWSNNDNNLIYSGDKPDTWGLRVAGHLADLTGSCPAGGTSFNLHFTDQLPKTSNQEACYPNCVKTRVFKGPSLTCVGH